MKTNSDRLSVGLVGFLQQRRPYSGGETHQSAPSPVDLVGWPHNPTTNPTTNPTIKDRAPAHSRTLATNPDINTEINLDIESDIEVERVIEATFTTTKTMVAQPVEYADSHAVTPVSPEFPPCPKCGSSRYWISRGLVLCGSRKCYSAVRFILTGIEYHPVH